jgi:hypothetical protein
MADKDELAYKLINTMAEALRQLCGNHQLPKDWKEQINTEFRTNRGRQKQLNVTERDIEITIRANALKHFYEIFFPVLNDKELQELKKQNTREIYQSYSASLGGLEDEYDLDRTDIFKIVKNYENHPTVVRETLSTICTSLKSASEYVEEPRKSHIENLLKTLSSKNTFKTESQRVSALLQAAEQLGFHADLNPFSGAK